eukprot:GHVP01018830.1.p1 GENE.GHVP01018830.1~~GHVP01018830.1.p1  ORF type:complete len:118 (+),score=0.59 GHVP01018830.1:54-407(+)
MKHSYVKHLSVYITHILIPPIYSYMQSLSNFLDLDSTLKIIYLLIFNLINITILKSKLLLLLTVMISIYLYYIDMNKRINSIIDEDDKELIQDLEEVFGVFFCCLNTIVYVWYLLII